jgi:hypothetical protein
MVVAVEPCRRLVDRKLEVNGIGAMAPCQLGPLLGTHDVIRRGNDCVERDDRVVTEPGEGLESGHATT